MMRTLTGRLTVAAVLLAAATPLQGAPRTITWTSPSGGRTLASDCTAPVPVAFPTGTQLMNLLELHTGSIAGPLVWVDSLTRSPGLVTTRVKDFPQGVSFLRLTSHTIGAGPLWGCIYDVTVMVQPDTCLCPPLAPTGVSVTGAASSAFGATPARVGR